MNVEIINIGDELLIGQVVNTNCSYMSKKLEEFGIKTKYVTVIEDNSEDIKQSILLALQRADCVLITGGLGPTKDDVTKYCLNELFGGNLVENKQVSLHVQQIFEKRGLPYTETNHSQAFVPDCCEVIFNEVGTAPGMIFNTNNSNLSPNLRNTNKLVISMPGVPFEMEKMMEKVIPILIKHYKPETIIHKHLLLSGIGESFLSDKLVPFEKEIQKLNSSENQQHFTLAYLPNGGLIKLRLSVYCGEFEKSNKIINQLYTDLKSRTKEFIISDNDKNIAQVIGELLLSKNQTLTTAESCTGGNIAHQITINSGASSYFKGSVVSYCNEIKNTVLQVPNYMLEEFGAVSEQTVIQMCKGALKLMNTDYAVSVSGLAGPNGDGTPTPVGTVCVCVMNKKGKYLTNNSCYNTTRQNFIDRATNLALFQLLTLLREDN
ncbi:MAG: CinA family nicotinamide mononucleotide deamidase-related protein [Bacteroidales bacterium]|nr:CinA family nicotinamide mononucleotide deamidase-related protein [Bacteroidales bacterium]